MTPPRERVPGSPGEWLRHAESDLRVARLALGDQRVLPEQICFHAQQAAEKALKAVLLCKQVEFPLVHDVEELLELARRGGLAVPPEVSEAGLLTPYAVEARYPGSQEGILPSDVEEAIRVAQAVLQWAGQTVAS